MGYLTYYLALLLLAYVTRYPWLVGLALGVYVFRPYLPDPWVWLRTAGRMRALEAQIAANPANITARRDLAVLYLERLRAGAALAQLDEARARDPDDAELLYLVGLARLRSGDAAGALEPLVRCVELDPRMRFGEPYGVAAEALVALGRLEEAEDALDRYTASNSSSIKGFVRLAQVRALQKNHEGSRAALDEALATWAQLPGYRRRQEVGWWLRAWLGRVWL